MARIEQLPDGTYVKRLTPFEADLVERLYQEIRERKKDSDEFRKKEIVLATSIESSINQIESLKTQIRLIKEEVGMPLD